jgi:hypothetical protein
MSCHLQSRYSFDDVIHLSVFGLAKAETLNERLRTLGRPTSTRRDNVERRTCQAGQAGRSQTSSASSNGNDTLAS